MGTSSALLARGYYTTPMPANTTTDPFATNPVGKAIGLILAPKPRTAEESWEGVSDAKSTAGVSGPAWE